MIFDAWHCLSLQSRLKEFPQLKNIGSDGARLLQLARSTPYVICALVGHKSAAHVDENLALSQVGACVSWVAKQPCQPFQRMLRAKRLNKAPSETCEALAALQVDLLTRQQFYMVFEQLDAYDDDLKIGVKEPGAINEDEEEDATVNKTPDEQASEAAAAEATE